MRRSSGRLSGTIVALLFAPLLAACEQEGDAPPASVRQVRTIEIEKRQVAENLSLTGRIEAEDEIPLAFRIAGRVCCFSRRTEPGFPSRSEPPLIMDFGSG